MRTKLIKYLFVLSLLAWLASTFMMQRLPPQEEIASALLLEPKQTLTKAAPFIVQYKGHSTTVTPVAEYELWGMVVSHNDPFVWYKFDITHDKYSLDTRDLCVIWGNNIKNSDYKDISVHNDDTFCIYKYGPGVRGYANENLSNNHLITNDDAIRKRIENVKIGDQIHLKGKLVNYSEARWNGGVRNSSTTRKDEGNGACEVVFVEELEILSSYNWIWGTALQLSHYGFLLTLLLGLLYFIMPRKLL